MERKISLESYFDFKQRKNERFDASNRILFELKSYFLDNKPMPEFGLMSYQQLKDLSYVLKLVAVEMPEKAIDLCLCDQNKKNKNCLNHFTRLLFYYQDSISYIYTNYPWYINTLLIFFDKKKFVTNDAFFLLRILDKWVGGEFSIKYEEFLIQFINEDNKPKNWDQFEEDLWGGNLIQIENYMPELLSAKILLALSKRVDIIPFRQYFKNFYSKNNLFYADLFPFVETVYGEDAKSIFIELWLEKEVKSGETNANLHHYLKQYELNNELDDIIDVLAKKPFEFQQKEVIVLNDIQELNFEYIEKLYKMDKKKNWRIALVLLSQIEEKESYQLFSYIFHQGIRRKNDRLEVLDLANAFLYKQSTSEGKVKEIIDAAFNRKAIRNWKEKYFDIEDLPPLVFISGERLDNKAIDFLFYRLNLQGLEKLDVELALLFKYLSQSSIFQFVEFLFQSFIENGAKANKKQWLLLFVFYGNENVFEKLQDLFKKLLDTKRTKMAQYIVSAVAQSNDKRAAKFLNFIKYKYKSKPSIIILARKLFTEMAARLMQTEYELFDYSLADFGFDGIYKTIMVGNTEYRVFLNENKKFVYLKDGKKFQKRMPSAFSDKDKVSLKKSQKEIRSSKNMYVENLELFMIEARQWGVVNWKHVFLENPLMFSYACNLVWTCVKKKKKESTHFYVTEDASILDIGDNEIDLDDYAYIDLMHPMNMEKNILDGWNQLFYELELVQPFLQLQRPVYLKHINELKSFSMGRYMNKISKKSPFSIQVFFEKHGWVKYISDYGLISMKKYDSTNNVIAELNINGLGAQFFELDFEFEIEIEMRDVIFSQIDNEHKMVAIQDVNDIFFSEVVLDLDQAVQLFF